MGHMMAFRTPGQDARVRQAAPQIALEGMAASSAAPVLEPQPPHPTSLNAQQADMALEAVQTQAQSGGADMLQAHSGLDARRVARLLNLLG